MTDKVSDFIRDLMNQEFEVNFPLYLVAGDCIILGVKKRLYKERDGIARFEGF